MRAEKYNFDQQNIKHDRRWIAFAGKCLTTSFHSSNESWILFTGCSASYEIYSAMFKPVRYPGNRSLTTITPNIAYVGRLQSLKDVT